MAKFEKLANTSSVGIQNATGKTWDEWIDELDKKEATKMSHKDTAEFVFTTYKVSGWWAQQITVGYEQAKGIRKPGERPEGFNVSVSKTINIPVYEIYRRWFEGKLRRLWWPDFEGQITTSNKNKNLRVKLPDGTNFEVRFTDMGETKSQIVIDHRKIKTEEEMTLVKQIWQDRMERLLNL